MAFFEKKTCEHCGNKAGLLSRVKLSEGYLCGECRKGLSSLSSGWRKRSYQDVLAHFDWREKNQQKVAAFRQTATLGPRQEVHMDTAGRQFLFALGRDWQEGNPEVFDYAQLMAFRLLESYDLSSPKEDENEDNAEPAGNLLQGLGALVTQALDGAQTAMLLSEVRPYIQSSGSATDSDGKRRPVRSLEAVLELNHPYVPEVRIPIVHLNDKDGERELHIAYREGLELMRGLENMVRLTSDNQPTPVVPQPTAPATAPPTDAFMAFCPACGAKNAADGAFCSACGRSLKQA